MSPRTLDRDTSGRTIRCAIYTRKSTEEGLDQEFNSLDAQRESAEAYIVSQRSEGWTCLPERYDDGGFSGGNIERPALQSLLHDIEEGKIDCLVVYKVDRLSRSLLDFTRLMEVLDRHKVSFVSVTQQFNTTTSMGRLTLNILLSFAQFEREIIAERTRDKMAAARRKGKWIGGHPLLGYDVAPEGGRIHVNEKEAIRVAAIFELYLERQSLGRTILDLETRGWKTKAWTTKKGKKAGGKSWTKNSLFKLLTNVAYLGKVKFRDVIYEGEHDAIIDAELWRKANELLQRNGRSGGKHVRNKHGALLKSLIYCSACKVGMSHHFTSTNGRIRYRYYVCNRAQQMGRHVCPNRSVSAPEIEQFVVEQIRAVGTDPALLASTLEQVVTRNAQRLQDLDRERIVLDRQLGQDTTEVRKLVARPETIGSDSPGEARLADLQERIRENESRLAEIREEIGVLSNQTVSEEDLASAFSRFDPVWGSLSPREKWRIIQLLIERVVFNADEGTVAITFHATGIHEFAGRMQRDRRSS